MRVIVERVGEDGFLADMTHAEYNSFIQRMSSAPEFAAMPTGWARPAARMYERTGQQALLTDEDNPPRGIDSDDMATDEPQQGLDLPEVD